MVECGRSGATARSTRLSCTRRASRAPHASGFRLPAFGFRLPADLARYGVPIDRLALDRAELRFRRRDARGFYGAPPRVVVAGRALPLQPGRAPAETDGAGFYTPVDARTLTWAPLAAAFRFAFRGNGWLGLVPQAGHTRWRVISSWPHPSFQSGFLPGPSSMNDAGFTATWRVGNLALGRALVSTSKPANAASADATDRAAVALPASDS